MLLCLILRIRFKPGGPKGRNHEDTRKDTKFFVSLRVPSWFPPVWQRALGLRVARASLVAALVVGASSLLVEVRGQDFVVPPQPAPPPMRYVPELLRAQLAAAPTPKERLLATLDLMEQYLARAEQHTSAQRYDPAAAELGIYLALVDDALDALRTVGRSPEGKVDSKTRDLYKRLELSLNKHTARIESVRRLTPQLYAGNVREAFRHARERRSEALDSFFTDTVVRMPDDTKKDSHGARPADKAKEPPKKDSDRPPPLR
jgi:hypothetical protein